ESEYFGDARLGVVLADDCLPPRLRDALPLLLMREIVFQTCFQVLRIIVSAVNAVRENLLRLRVLRLIEYECAARRSLISPRMRLAANTAVEDDLGAVQQPNVVLAVVTTGDHDAMPVGQSVHVIPPAIALLPDRRTQR